ncbi:hypothetical protein HQ544_02025 [Candidatus Falkowbacteria bacterium]|nr:hypothetical protein [Candidatus Falkowbacteria bacterium]
MKKIVVICMGLLLVGCASSKMDQKGMFSGPNFDKAQLESMVNIVFPLPAKLDVADSAFLYDFGIKTPSYSWKAMRWNKKGKEWQVVGPFFAVRLEQSGKEPRLLISFPGVLKDMDGDLVAVADHSGTRLYNQKGKYIKVAGGWSKVSPGDYQGFFTAITVENSLEIKQDSPEYTAMMEFYKKFQVLEALQMRDYVYKKLGIPVGTALSKEQLEKVDGTPIGEKLKELFLDKWYVLFTYPLLSPVDYGLFIMVAKVFQIPTMWWKDDLNKPGYMDRTLTAESAFDMMEYYQKRYSSGYSAPTIGITPQEQEALEKATGQNFNTYQEYLVWWTERNKEIEEYNQSLR